MTNKVTLGLYLMTSKGLATLRALSTSPHKSFISHIVVARDKNVINDYTNEIIDLANSLQIPIFERSQTPPLVSHLIAVSWRWLIETSPDQKLIVFHDSILPRYRGFAPLVSALINGDKHLGVTALLASAEYDRGPVIEQEIIEIEYPITISKAIDLLLPCYSSLSIKIVHSIITKNIKESLQNEANATYSLWRDEQDYYIDWKWDSHYIKRFVDALGPPYKGAATTLNGETFRIRECTLAPDVKIENRTTGKVIFTEENSPIIVCGTGLIKIINITKENTQTNILPLPKFRTRFI